MRDQRVPDWIEITAAWAVAAALIAVTAAIVSAQPPASSQPSGVGREGGLGGAFSDEFIAQLAVNLDLPVATVRDALDQVQPPGPMAMPVQPAPGNQTPPPAGPAGAGGPLGPGGAPFDPALAPGGFAGASRDPSAFPGAFPGGPPDLSAIPAGPFGAGLPPSGPPAPFVDSLAEQLASVLGLPVDTVWDAVQQTFEQVPSPMRRGRARFEGE